VADPTISSREQLPVLLPDRISILRERCISGLGCLYAFRTVIVAALPTLGTLHFMPEENQFRVTMTGSLKFAEQGKRAEALKLLDDAIAEAKRDQMASWIRTLCHHAAIVSRFSDNLTSAQHYYEESLASDPKNARALYGLATVALDQGHLEIAKQYAKRCHTAICCAMTTKS
jgi:tetratricopeptide (TPR) repeat protein